MHTHAYVMARDAEDNLLKLVLSCHPAGPQSWWSHCPSLGSQKTSACHISRIFLSRGRYPKRPYI